MKYKITKKENDFVTADVTVSEEKWQNYLQAAYEKNKEKYSVQGFRKGKAPRSVIEKNYGSHVFVQDAMDVVFNDVFDKILNDNDWIRAYDAPKLDLKDYNEKKGIAFTLDIPCLPQFELGQYKGLTFEKHLHTVTEEMVKEQIDRELLRASKLIDSQEKSKMDDYVIIDFEGFIDGVAFEGGKSNDYQLKLGSHTFIDNFEEQLTGLKTGEEKEVDVNFPADYHESKFAGKKATFKVKIKAVKTRLMPEFNDAFVSDSSEFETVEEFTADIKNKLVQREQERTEIELGDKMTDAVVANTNIVLPDLLIEKELDYMIKELSDRLSQHGIKLEDYVQYTGKTIEQYRQEQKEIAIKNLKIRLVLQELISKEKINVTPEQFEQKVKQFAKLANKTEEEFVKNMNNNQIYSAVLNDNIIEFLKQNNNIK